MNIIQLPDFCFSAKGYKLTMPKLHPYWSTIPKVIVAEHNKLYQSGGELSFVEIVWFSKLQL